MKSITKITIPQPCHEQWDNMTNTKGGRHCNSCAKTVVDFTFMSNAQIIEHLSKAGNVCGKFSDRQIDNMNNELHTQNLQSVSWYKRLMLAVALFSTVPFLKSSAQNKPATTQSQPTHPAENAPFMLGKVLPQKDTASSVKMITGKVTDNKHEALPGVTITIKGTKTDVTTNEDGSFRLYISSLPALITVSYIGYESQELSVTKQQAPYNIVLNESRMLLGEVVVIKTPFYKKWYRRFIKRPIHKIFG